MRASVIVILFALGAVANAQPVLETEDAAPQPPPAPPPATPAATPGPLPPGHCRADYNCPGRERCVDSVCVDPGAHSSNSSSSTASRVSVNVGIFGEWFPSSSVRVPGSSGSQMSMLAGLRVGVGYHRPKWLRAIGILEGGYTAAGKEPGKGEQGLSFGFGAEADLDLLEAIKPFVRFTYDNLLTRISSSGQGRLADSAWLFAVGIRASIVDVHVIVGSDFAGGISPGIGFGLGWMN